MDVWGREQSGPDQAFQRLEDAEVLLEERKARNSVSLLVPPKH